MAFDHFLIVSESFYSIQGEGACAGAPSVFLRLAGCNLRCLGFSYKDPDTGEHLGCDSKLLWRKGDRYSFDAIVDDWSSSGWLDRLASGAHLVVTGGEPLIQQAAIILFLKYLDSELSARLFVEMETNASLPVHADLLKRVDQFNVSPKLKNSGESRSKAYCFDTLLKITQSNKAKFKFVLMDKEDIDEVLEAYVQPLDLDNKQVWLMPEGGTAEIIASRAPWVVDLCKQHLFHYSPRLQVDIWGEVTGV